MNSRQIKKYLILSAFITFYFITGAKTECRSYVVSDNPAEIEIEDNETKEKRCVACPYLRKFNYFGKCSPCVGSGHLQIEDDRGTYCNGYATCKGYLSQKKTQCWKKQCKNNQDGRYDLIRDEVVECYQSCENEKPYYSQKLHSCSDYSCILTNNCSGYLSSDEKACSYRCQKSEIPRQRVRGENFTRCQKCPDQKPFINSNFDSCVDKCSSTEILQEKYNQCLSNDDVCNHEKEDQVLILDQKKCSVECPNGYSKEGNDKLQLICTKCKPEQFVQRSNPVEIGKSYSKCVDMCENDDDVGDIETKKCISKYQCDNKKGFIDKEKKLCYQTCPPNTYKFKYVTEPDECVKKCWDGYLVDVETQRCILRQDCKGFIQNQKECLKQCPDDKWSFKSDFENSCYDECYGGLYIQNDSYRQCGIGCKEGEIMDNKSRRCLKSKEECKYNISSDGLSCLENCKLQEYIVKKGQVNYCQFCFGLLQKSNPSDTEPNQCVTQCSISSPYIKITRERYNIAKECSTKENCKDYLISSDNKFCTQNICIYPEMQEIQNGIEKCVKKCSSENIYITPQYDCTQTCQGQISNNNKYCLDQCNDISEIKLNNKCQQCNKGEYQGFDTNKYQFVCNKETNDQTEIERKMSTISRNQSDKEYSRLRERYDYNLDLLQSILYGLESNNLIKQKQDSFVDLIYKLQFQQQKMLLDKSSMILKTDKIKFISQSLSLKQAQQYNLSITWSKLNEDNPDLTLPLSNNNQEFPTFIPTSILFVISKNNYLCSDSNSPEKCFYDTELFQVLYDVGESSQSDKLKNQYKQTEFSVLFDNIDTKYINSYTCLTTNNGIMSGSIKTEVLSNPPGIRCTFKNNVTLFHKQCPQDKPYLLGNDCVSVCPQKLDPLKKMCVSKVEDCSLISDDGKECVANCSNEQPYLAKLSDKQSACQISCKSGQIINEESKQCYNDKDGCKLFLIDDKICQSKCPDDKFQFQYEKTPYKQCNSICQFNSNETGNKNLCYLECRKENTYATVDSQDKPLKKYCFSCPKNSSFKTKFEDFTACSSECKSSQIVNYELSQCLTSKDQCSDFLRDGKFCLKFCLKEHYRYINETTTYKQCNSWCDLFSYTQDGNQICDKSCLPQHIVDKETKKCLNKKSECKKFVSSNGTECNSKCVEEEDEVQYIESKGDYKQCRVCRNFISEENNSNEINVKCLSQCNEYEMIYIFGKKNQLKKCVSEYFCEQKKKSAENPLICSDKCIKPEINHGEKCVLKCPEKFFYSPTNNNCIDNCDQDYKSSDNLLCVSNCEKIFETVDESIQDKKNKKCKKCSNSQGSQQVICKTIEKTEDARDAMLKDLIKKFQTEDSVQSVQEVQAAQKAINSYAAEVGNKLKDLALHEEKTDKDKAQAKLEFKNILDITSQFLSCVDSQISQKPVNIGTQELMVTSQVAQPGKKFKTSFTSSDIQQGTTQSLLENDLNDDSALFTPFILQVSYLKNNHFCEADQCKNSQPLFVVTYLNKSKKRVLAENNSQYFNMMHAIPQDQELSKLWCQSYDSNGKAEYFKGEIKDNKINCKFQYGSALFYDKDCKLDQKDCKLKEEEEDDNDSSNRLSGGAIAGIVIGIIVVIGLAVGGIVYYQRKRKGLHGRNKKYEAQDQQEKVITVYDNKVIDTYNDFEQIQKKN